MRVGYLGGWTLDGREIKGHWTEAVVEAQLPMPNLSNSPRLYLYYCQHSLSPSRTELELTWDASLGDFDTGLIGDPIFIKLDTKEIESKLPQIMKIIEYLGVTAEVRKGLDERGIEEKIKLVGKVSDINFTILFPNTLFNNFILESHQPRHIFAQLPPTTANY